ncbi:E3 ubiquitin-protein ligase TRIM4 [Choloepus didactylus]|uniref:E3 ubiquitin-protein ligase TRIM4 n=1 Tax=Choloepus didactylus TaxID=27675 RepID=UPI00189D103C|nr:E3 ubiquitin-protein ligase TRIM4 [Choloepus didactylus]
MDLANQTVRNPLPHSRTHLPAPSDPVVSWRVDFPIRLFLFSKPRRHSVDSCARGAASPLPGDTLAEREPSDPGPGALGTAHRPPSGEGPQPSPDPNKRETARSAARARRNPRVFRFSRCRQQPTPAAEPSSATKAEDLREEVTCSICLDYFEDPVCTECSHNFCRDCLQRSWAHGGPFSCPECRQLSEPGALRPNRALARLTEKTRRLRLDPAPRDLCGRHGEPLRLFCEDDQRPVCVVCRESLEHQGHAMAPLDEALQSYREKLLKCHVNLVTKMKKALQLKSLAEKNTADCQETMKNQRRTLSAEFAKLHQFLAEEEQLYLQKLTKEEEETKKKLKENKLNLEHKISSLKKLISELGEKRQSSTLELLQNPKDVLTRSEEQDVEPALDMLTVKTMCQIPVMKEMLKRFQVAVTFAEGTAHPELSFSREGRYAKNRQSSKPWPLIFTPWGYFSEWREPQRNTHFVERFQHLPCVMGKNVFTSGKYYWEVESQDSLDTAVGVCQEDATWISDSLKMCPCVGIWALRWSACGYCPLTGSPETPTKQEPPLRRVGIFLDYEAGDVSFYNAADGTHLHTFSCQFISCIRPFFWLSPLAALVIPPVTDRK